MEGNPLLHWLMGATGHGPALALAKLAAAGFGMVLHLASVHRAVALLTLLYLSAASLASASAGPCPVAPISQCSNGLPSTSRPRMVTPR